jgi:uncharacterized membrane protein YgdD (TMEM256/DUF423 family)
MTNTQALRLTAILGFLAVTLGAFGAHGLGPTLRRNGTESVWETAVFYHFVHTLVLLWLAGRAPLLKGPWYAFAIGILVFSGTLYALAITNVRWLGAVTPIGGVSFLVGWVWLAVSAKDKAA